MSPNPAFDYRYPKLVGDFVALAFFTVVDSATSNWLYHNLLERNCPNFSGYSYAYRSDRTGHHAIEHLAKTMKRKQRAYILEYDFRNYFDSVDHRYLREVITENVLCSPRERAAADAFLQYRFADGLDEYGRHAFVKSERGFPQGATISLFFANIACLELDREIESTGATFARFADDTIIMCDDYGVANRLARIMALSWCSIWPRNQ